MRALAGKRFEAHFVCVVGAVRDTLFTPTPALALHPTPALALAPALAQAPSPSPKPQARTQDPAQARDTLFTLNARVPEARWAEAREGLLAAAASFELLE